MKAPEYLDSVEQRMSGSKFRVSRNVVLGDGRTVGLAATANRFSWKGLVLISQNLIVVHEEAPTAQDVRALLDAGFDYAKRVNKVPLLRGMQFGYMVIPCIVSSGLSPEVIGAVTAQPRKRWSLSEFPVAHDFTSGATHYYTGRSAWGVAFFSELRSLVATYLESDKPTP